MLLESLGDAGRTRVRAVASPASKTLVSMVPLPPPERVGIDAFGPLHVNGASVARPRVRELLGLLLLRRKMSRTEITAELWPDLSDRAARGNLRVTLAYVLRVLEPDRHEGDAAFFIRQDGAALRLVTDMLEIDFDDFNAHLDAAAAAETNGAPSVALDSYIAATDLYRGDLLADLPNAAWADIERERCRARFVRAAIRGGDLLRAAGDLEEAEHLARRALAVDEWAEPAYAILVTAALARGERSAAVRILEQCATMLTALGVEPSEPTRRLIRRLQS
jgi:DNA-binding SARP family transcriptional activator